MTNKSQKLVFFGSEQWGVKSLKSLLDHGYNIVAVVTRADAPAGRKRELKSTPIKEFAVAHNLNVIEPNSSSELFLILDEIKPDLGVLIAYGKIIPEKVISLFPLGIINFHPSDLPRYRGPSPIETAILDGAELGIISFIKLDKGMDSGDILAKHKINIPNIDKLSAPSIYDKLGEIGANLLVDDLTKLIEGNAKFIKRDHSGASFSKMIEKLDGFIDVNESAENNLKRIRAYSGWPGCKSEILGTEVSIIEAHAIAQHSDDKENTSIGSIIRLENNELGIATSSGILVIDKLVPAGKRLMSGKDFLLGKQI